MLRTISLALASIVMVFSSGTVSASVPEKGVPYVSLTRQFAEFVDQTQNLPDDKRVALFREQFNTLFPGFFELRNGEDSQKYNARIAKNLKEFPELRSAYEAVERAFPGAYAAGIAHFNKFFPGFKPTLPVYFLHSLGEMDGGTRTIRDKQYLVFGADVIARVEGPTGMGPFLDHEFFHVENLKYLQECDTIWCALWTEGLATYAASTMNPEASDAALMLDFPAPIRPKVDADWPGALCLAYAKRNSTDSADYRMLFTGGGETHPYPARFGYYIGLKIAQRLGKNHSLAELTYLDEAGAHALFETEISAMVAEVGGCEKTSVALPKASGS